MNPLAQINAQKPQINPQMIKGIKSYMNTMKMAQNPNMVLSALSQQNPQIQEIIEMCAGRDPKAVFEEKCQQMGIDPQDIINQLM